ncbi:MAG: metallophosphoesterase [Eubacteriales bacterium]|nr:metallophosphoesterase [Eubacteriales bacterium]
MPLFAISDLHLSFGTDKPMDIFGEGWSGYTNKLSENWKRTVGPDDHVIIPGDISWAMNLKEAYADFAFIESLPGKKIISKGNHDYYWTTAAKLNRFIDENGFGSISFMHNNGFVIENIAICGTRGWKSPGDKDFSDEDNKVYRRELQRLEASLKETLKYDPGIDIVAALHYPPFNARREPTEFVGIMKKYGVKTCIYGHLHSEGIRGRVEGIVDGIDYRLVSADHLLFMPMKLN